MSEPHQHIRYFIGGPMDLHRVTDTVDIGPWWKFVHEGSVRTYRRITEIQRGDTMIHIYVHEWDAQRDDR